MECESRWNIWNWSRQVGKSHGISLRRLIRGLKRKKRQIFMSAGERQSAEIMDKVRLHLKALQIAAGPTSVIQDAKVKILEIDIPGYMKVTAIPSNPDTARGYTGDIFLDEFAMHEKAREVWGAIMPATLRNKGEIDISSTPKGVSDMFAELSGNESFNYSKVTIYDAISQGLDADAEAYKKLCSDDAMWRQEFLCEFIDGASVFLPMSELERCVDALARLHASPAQLAKLPYELAAGYDVGRRHDNAVLYIVSKRDDRYVTEACIVMKQTPFADQEATVRSYLDACPNLIKLNVDSSPIGMQMSENLGMMYGTHRVEGQSFSAGYKKNVAGKIKMAIQAGDFLIPDDELLLNDFHSIRKVVTNAGNIILDSKGNKESHGDRFWSAAMALDGFSNHLGGEIAIAVCKTRF